MSAESKRKIVLLEDEYYVTDFINNFGKDTNILPIALSPFASQELLKLRINFNKIEDYYTPIDIHKVGIENYYKVEKICSILDRHIQEVYPETKDYDLKPAFFNFYHFKIIYDAATVRLFQLFKLIEKEKPLTIYTYNPEVYPFGFSERAEYLVFDSDESLYTHLLGLDGWDAKRSLLQYNKNNGYRFNNSIKIKLKFLLQLLGLFSIAKSIKYKGLQGLTTSLSSSIILFGGAYNWESCENLFRKNGFGSYLRVSDNLEYWARKRKDYYSNYKKAFEIICDDRELKELFRYENIDFFPFLESRIRFFIQVLVPSCIQAYSESKELIRKNNVKSLLFSSFMSGTSKSFAKAAKDSKVPVFNWQHGGYGHADHPIIPYLDFVSSDIYFSFGNGLYEKYSDFERKYGFTIVPIGSSLLDNLKKEKNKPVAINLDQNKKTILYASTLFHQNLLYVSYFPVFSDNLLFIAQKSILDVLEKHSDYNVIIKTHDNLNFRETPLRTYASEKGYKTSIFIRNEYRFADLLSISDAIIIDFPAMTLLEAITTKKPVFTNTFFYNLDKEAESILKRRAYCYSSIEQLTNGLNEFLNSGEVSNHPSVDVNNRDFIKKYGTYLDDGKSAERAVEFVKKYISNSKR